MSAADWADNDRLFVQNTGKNTLILGATSQFREQVSEVGPNLAKAQALIDSQDDYSVVVPVVFESDSIGSKTYHYKTSIHFSPGDFAVVGVSGKFKIVMVVGTALALDTFPMAARVKMKYIVQRVHTEVYQSRLDALVKLVSILNKQQQVAMVKAVEATLNNDDLVAFGKVLNDAAAANKGLLK